MCVKKSIQREIKSLKECSSREHSRGRKSSYWAVHRRYAANSSGNVKLKRGFRKKENRRRVHISRIRFNGSSPLLFPAADEIPENPPRKVGTRDGSERLEKSKSRRELRGRKKKKERKGRATVALRKQRTATPAFLPFSLSSLCLSFRRSYALLRSAHFLPRSRGLFHPLSTYFRQSVVTPSIPRSRARLLCVPVLYSESTFSQCRNRSRIGAWRSAIRRAGREIVLS